MLPVHVCVPVAQELLRNFPVQSSTSLILGFHSTKGGGGGNIPLPQRGGSVSAAIEQSS